MATEATEAYDPGKEEFDLEDVETGDLEDFKADPKARGDFVDDDDEAETDEAETDEAETDEAETDEVETDEAETDEAETGEESDGDAETDEESDDKAETDETETDEVDESGVRIPKSRFDAVNTRRKEAEQEVARLRSQIESGDGTRGQGNQLETLNTKIQEVDAGLQKAVRDGDDEKFAELNAQRSQLSTQLTDLKINVAKDSAVEETRYDMMIDQIEADHPEFDENSEVFNQELVDETLELQDAFIAKGSKRADALIKALDYTSQRYGLGEKKTESAGLRKKSTEKPARETTTKKARNEKAAKAQPASTSKKNAAPKADQDVDVTNLTPEKIAKMDRKELSRLRGDVA